MATINSFLAEAAIAFIDDGLGAVDTTQTTLKRHFRAADADDFMFNKGGRLFGGWWQNLKSDRRRHIRIDGEPVAVLDFSSMFPRLAYAEVNAVPPEGDLYAILGLEGHRSAVKSAMNCLLFDTNNHRSTWPSELVNPPDESSAGAAIPSQWTVARMRAAILKKHPLLKEVLGRGLGLRLMCKESVILVEVLKGLRAKGVVALGLHDGLIVPRSRVEIARGMMVEVGHAITGMRLPVTDKALA